MYLSEKQKLYIKQILMLWDELGHAPSFDEFDNDPRTDKANNLAFYFRCYSDGVDCARVFYNPERRAQLEPDSPPSPPPQPVKVSYKRRVSRKVTTKASQDHSKDVEAAPEPAIPVKPKIPIKPLETPSEAPKTPQNEPSSQPDDEAKESTPSLVEPAAEEAEEITETLVTTETEEPKEATITETSAETDPLETDSETSSKIEPEPEAEIEAEPEPKPETKSEPELDPEPEPKDVPKPAPAPEVEPTAAPPTAPNKEVSHMDNPKPTFISLLQDKIYLVDKKHFNEVLAGRKLDVEPLQSDGAIATMLKTEMNVGTYNYRYNKDTREVPIITEFGHLAVIKDGKIVDFPEPKNNVFLVVEREVAEAAHLLGRTTADLVFPKDFTYIGNDRRLYCKKLGRL